MNNTTTNATFMDPSIPSSSEAERIFKIVFYSFLFLVGTIGNLLVVLVIKAKHKHRTVNDCFILNLAISDLTFLCFALPFYYYELFKWFTKFQFYCKFVWPMMSISLFVSIFTLTLMAMERCRAILFPFRPRVNKPTLFIGILSVWTLSIICIVPLMIVSNADGVYCTERWPRVALRKAYTALLFILQFAVPVVIIAIAYITIAITLVTAKVPNRTSINNEGQLVKQKSRTDNIHIIRTVAIIVALFVICMLPNQIAWILTDFGGKQYENLSAKFWLLAEALMFFHSCINPIIYGSLTRQFREGYIKYIHFVCCCGRTRKKKIVLSENLHNVTKIDGTNHCRLAYRGSLGSPSSANDIKSSGQPPTRITSCHLVSSRSPPSPARSPRNVNRNTFGSIRTSPKSTRSLPNSSRWHSSSTQMSPNSLHHFSGSSRPYSGTARQPSPLVIDNKLSAISDKISSLVVEEDEIKENEIFTTNPVVHCNSLEELTPDIGDLLQKRQERASGNENASLELQLGATQTDFAESDAASSTVLANPHAEQTPTSATKNMAYETSQPKLDFDSTTIIIDESNPVSRRDVIGGCDSGVDDQDGDDSAVKDTIL